MSEHADDTHAVLPDCAVTLVSQQNELLSAMEGCVRAAKLRDMIGSPADAYDQLMTCCRLTPKKRRKSTAGFEKNDLTTGCSVIHVLTSAPEYMPCNAGLRLGAPVSNAGVHCH